MLTIAVLCTPHALGCPLSDGCLYHSARGLPFCWVKECSLFVQVRNLSLQCLSNNINKSLLKTNFWHLGDLHRISGLAGEEVWAPQPPSVWGWAILSHTPMKAALLPVSTGITKTEVQMRQMASLTCCHRDVLILFSLYRQPETFTEV